MQILTQQERATCIERKTVLFLEQGIKWLVIDAAIYPEPVWEVRGKGLMLFSIFNQHDAALMDKGPWLIDIDGHEDLIRSVLDRDLTGYGCLWLDSELDPFSLIQQLQMRVYAELPNGEISRFRWYDARVLSFYLHHIDLERQTAFLAPITQLLYADFNPFYVNQRMNQWQFDGYSYQEAQITLMEEIIQ